MHFALCFAPLLVIAVVGAPFPGVRSDLSLVERSPLVPKAGTAANLVCNGSKPPEQAEVHAKPSGLKQSRDDADEASQYDEVEAWGVKRHDDADEAPRYAKVEAWGVKRHDDADEASRYAKVEAWGAKRHDDADEASQYAEMEGWGAKRNDVADESKA